jgi:hypothetical protein
MQSTLQSSERVLPDEDTVMNLIAAAGWEYKPMYLFGKLHMHQLWSPDGSRYMIPVDTGMPQYINVWYEFKQLNHL